MCVSEREGKFVLSCPCSAVPLLNGAISAIYTLLFLGLLYLGVHVLRCTYFSIIVLIIVTEIEFLVARITDGVDSPPVTKTATWINLESIDLCYSSLVDLELKESTMVSTLTPFIHSFIHSLLILGQFTSRNNADTKCSNVTSLHSATAIRTILLLLLFYWKTTFLNQ